MTQANPVHTLTESCAEASRRMAAFAPSLPAFLRKRTFAHIIIPSMNAERVFDRRTTLLFSLTAAFAAVACAGILGIPEDRVLGTTSATDGGPIIDAKVEPLTCTTNVLLNL
jgi:hypothetical protein